jgi:hypothetical protein
MSKVEIADLAALDTVSACNKPQEFELVHPVSRLGLGVFFTVVGKDSDVYRNRIRALADENLRRANAGLPGDTSLSKLEAKNIDTLVACITGWRSEADGVVRLNGDELKFTTDNVRKVLTDLPPAREQVQEAVNDLGKFLPG